MEIENLNIDLAALVERMKGANGGITIKDRKYLGKTFERSFSGKEAVEWFTKNIPNITEDQAIIVGKSLLTKKYIKHATTRKGFANTHLIFQFSQPPTRGACGYSETSISDLAPDELFEVFQITVREGMFRERPGLRAFIVHKPTATGTEALDWLSRRFAVSRGRAREVATQLVTNKFMSSICGSLDFSESRWYLPTNIEFLNAIDRAEDLLLPNLVLTGFQISYIPSRLADLPHIKTLDLSTNNIGQVCGNISTLPVLEDLILANNHIEYITSEISNLRSLRKLDLHNNCLTSLSPSIAKLPLLETLILDNNNIVELPHEFSTLSKLKVLSMTNNQLKEIPDCVSGMHTLQVLNLQNNKEISSIPAFIAGLNELQEIRLDNNNIEQIPAFLGGLPKIKFIGLNGNNKIQCPPKSVIELGSEGIINYLKDLQSSTVPCFCGKMLILGMENVGKTSLLQAIQAPDKKFLRSPRVSKAKNLSTDGISISCVTLDSYLKEAPSEGPFITEKGLFRKKIIERLNLSIWDFAGQDTYYTTHEFFLTDNAIYTVVWDIRKDPEESRVDFWLKSIQARAPNAPVILVATHVDLVEKNKIIDLLSAVEAKYIKKYPQIALIECVSTYSLEGMKEFKKDLRKLAMEQPFIRSRIPGKHYGLAQAVVDERRTRNPPIASWEEYQEIAKLVFINEPKSLDLVTRHLHELGFLMHFREESLKNTVILSPQWLSDCFSSIITVKNTFCKNGRLPLKSLPLIWKSDSFPISLQGKLLRMLEIFEVLFIMRKPNIPENELEAIVPSLLPAEQPKNLQQTWDSILLKQKEKEIEKEKELDGAEQKEDEHIFKRKFEFSFITRAFFSRLLVRLLHVGEPLEYWRHGIISKKKGAAGLVRFEPVECVLDITVKCNKFDAGADLFSVILDNVNTLISDWPKVNARVTIPCVCSDACHTAPHQFQIQEIENMLLVQAGYLTCPKTGINVCLDGLAPDLSLANLKGNKIDPAEITGLEPIGSGSFADVFKAGFKGEVVAVKQLTLEDGDSRSIRFSDLTSSESLTSGSFSSSLNDSLTSDMSDLSINNSLNNTQNNNNSNDSRSFGHSVSLSSLKSTSQKSVSDTMLDYLHEFRREVVLMSTLQHENIVNMKGFCYEPYSIIMEYMDQGSLTTYVKNNKNNGWNVKLNLALDIARGMKFLHNTSPPLVHRDLKSPNVLLKAIPQAPFIQAKISDFGLSRTLVSGFVSKVVDNPRWCAPEIIKKTEYDEKSDVYSFGIILWELLTGEHPFAEFDIKWTHVLEDKIVQEHLRPTIPSDCPSDFSELIKQSWADSPKMRPSFVEIVSTLEDMLQASL